MRGARASRGLVIGAPRSGAGKTTITLGLLAAFRQRGLAVRAAKSGPDYIDPGFLAAAAGAPCCNLDSWAMPPALLAGLLAQSGQDADLLLVESAMGLFDGAGSPGRSGAAADIAAAHGLPVLLVLDVSGQSQSAAAVARGFALHDPRVRVAGVVLNRVGSERHASQARTAIEATGLGVLGALPRDATLALPERHLGLVQAHEHDALAAHLARLAEAMARHVDLDAIAAIATALPGARPASVSTALPGAGPAPVALRPPGQRIALAEDAAFSFTYPHVLEGWRKGGASIHPFSPLADEAPPDGCDAAWLPGGYPELHAGALAAARNFQDGLRRFAATKPVHGECGGFMVLGTGLEDADGTRHAMTGLLGHATSFARRRLALGYREATLLEDGRVLRGHEFHYATISEPGNDAPWASFADATGKVLGPAGARRGLVSGSFFHAIAEAD